jgi:uncharacterized membrane-anchored protein
MTSGNAAGGFRDAVREAAVKVPPIITAFFWAAKIISTGQGEATADFLYFHYGAVKAGTLGMLLLVAALVLQFSVRRYMTWVYWLAVASVSITGTMVADGMHLVMKLPYSVTTALYAGTLAVIFIVWYLTERTLSIHSISTWRRELFYWLAVGATFALGTALGDLTAVTFKIGYFKSAVVFFVLILIPLVAYWRFHMNPVLAFWFAYTLTRPLGASVADWLGVPHYLGGLDWGRGIVAIVLLVPLVIVVAYMAVSRVDIPRGGGDRAPQAPVRARHRAA